MTDVNDNAPRLSDFQVIFNNFKDYFPTGTFGQVPAFDADVSDKLIYRIISGNNANLVQLNESTGMLTLSSQLNTNVPKIASMEISVTGNKFLLDFGLICTYLILILMLFRWSE